MAEQAKLQVQKRTVLGKAVKQLRRQGVIPANLTGRHSEPVAIQVDRTALERFMKDHGRTTLINMAIPGTAEQTAMIAHVQREPVSGKIQHVDFMQIEMNQPMKVRVPIHVEGESPAVKSGDGILLHLRNDIEVEALPSDLPESLTIDVSGLEKVDDAVYMRDINLPPRAPPSRKRLKRLRPRQRRKPPKEAHRPRRPRRNSCFPTLPNPMPHRPSGGVSGSSSHASTRTRGWPAKPSPSCCLKYLLRATSTQVNSALTQACTETICLHQSFMSL